MNLQTNSENLTCTGGRRLAVIPEDLQKMEEEAMFLAYADTLLCQMPCFRMNNSTRRNRLYLDPYLKGIIYHTIKFCDYYGFEYASIKKNIKVPMLKIETDFTSQSAGQLLTRIQAFSETIEGTGLFFERSTKKLIKLFRKRQLFCGFFKKFGIEIRKILSNHIERGKGIA